MTDATVVDAAAAAAAAAAGSVQWSWSVRHGCDAVSATTGRFTINLVQQQYSYG